MPVDKPTAHIANDVPELSRREVSILGLGLAAGLVIGFVSAVFWLRAPEWVGHNGRAYKVIDLGCVSPRGCW